MTDETVNANTNQRRALADARLALNYATQINDRPGMVVAMRRIRLAKAALTPSEHGAKPPEAA